MKAEVMDLNRSIGLEYCKLKISNKLRGLYGLYNIRGLSSLRQLC